MRDREAAKRLLLDIVAAAGGRLDGKVKLYKTFYYTHLFFWKNHSKALTTYPIVRMPNGPGVDDGDILLRELRVSGQLRVEKQSNFGYDEFSFELGAPRPLDKQHPAYGEIMEALAKMASETAASASRKSHEDSRTWRNAKDGEELNIYLDLLSDTEYEKLAQASADVDAAVDVILPR